jgi:hypothetical protein
MEIIRLTLDIEILLFRIALPKHPDKARNRLNNHGDEPLREPEPNHCPHPSMAVLTGEHCVPTNSREKRH